MSPEEVSGGGNSDNGLDILSSLEKLSDEREAKSNLEDINELPTDTSENTETSEETEKEEGKKEEKDELAELEEELKEPTEEDLELKVPVQRRLLKEKYPNIFKDFPNLDSTIFRERAYTEILPTIQDAKEAASALTTLQNFEKDLMAGETSNMLTAVKSEDPKGFAKLVDNYMDNLRTVDEGAWSHVIGNVAKDIIAHMFAFDEGKKDEEKVVSQAASILYQWMFNSTKWEGKKKLSSDVINDTVNVERQKFLEEKKNFEQSKEKEQTDKVMTSVQNQIKGTIEKSIDPKNQMTPFIKAKAVEEILNRADALLKKDKRFQDVITLALQRAKKEGYTEESVKRVKSTYYNKYNGILLPIAKAVKSEALKGVSRKNNEEKENNDTTERANRVTADRNKNGGNNDNYRTKPKPGESPLDFLLRRA